ncbi:hypothetical protein BASA61_004912 [Batrachochytrium salamandrivorans]|nr:hypothetical protein BASA61_004912 [Batrachochytrium salamandrivorans]
MNSHSHSHSSSSNSNSNYNTSNKCSNSPRLSHSHNNDRDLSIDPSYHDVGYDDYSIQNHHSNILPKYLHPPLHSNSFESTINSTAMPNWKSSPITSIDRIDVLRRDSGPKRPLLTYQILAPVGSKQRGQHSNSLNRDESMLQNNHCSQLQEQHIRGGGGCCSGSDRPLDVLDPLCSPTSRTDFTEQLSYGHFSHINPPEELPTSSYSRFEMHSPSLWTLRDVEHSSLRQSPAPSLNHHQNMLSAHSQSHSRVSPHVDALTHEAAASDVFTPIPNTGIASIAPAVSSTSIPASVSITSATLITATPTRAATVSAESLATAPTARKSSSMGCIPPRTHTPSQLSLQEQHPIVLPFSVSRHGSYSDSTFEQGSVESPAANHCSHPPIGHYNRPGSVVGVKPHQDSLISSQPLSMLPTRTSPPLIQASRPTSTLPASHCTYTVGSLSSGAQMMKDLGRTTSISRRGGKGIVRPWTIDEDHVLLGAIRKFGTQWTRIASIIPNRNRRQCKEHWARVLSKQIPETDAASHNAITTATGSPTRSITTAYSEYTTTSGSTCTSIPLSDCSATPPAQRPGQLGNIAEGIASRLDHSYALQSSTLRPSRSVGAVSNQTSWHAPIHTDNSHHVMSHTNLAQKPNVISGNSLKSQKHCPQSLCKDTQYPYDHKQSTSLKLCMSTSSNLCQNTEPLAKHVSRRRSSATVASEDGTHVDDGTDMLPGEDMAILDAANSSAYIRMPSCLRAYDSFGPRWVEISRHIAGRNHRQCEKRFRRIKKAVADCPSGGIWNSIIDPSSLSFHKAPASPISPRTQSTQASAYSFLEDAPPRRILHESDKSSTLALHTPSMRLPSIKTILPPDILNRSCLKDPLWLFFSLSICLYLPLLVKTGIGSLLTRSLVSRVRLLERSVTKKTPINAICSGTDNGVLALNVQGRLVKSQRWFWSRRTKQLYRNRYWLTPQVRPKTVKQRHSFALMETLRTCGDSASLQKYVTRQLLDTSGFFKDPSFDQSRAHGTRYLMLARMDALWTARKAIQIGILVDTHPFSVDHCILCDQQLLSTSIAHLVVECEQVAGHRIQSGLVPAIQKSRLRLLGRALDPGVENVYTWLRGGVLNGEADLDQRWLDGTVEHESMGTRHDNRVLAAQVNWFSLQVAYRQYQSTLWKYHRDRLVEVG